MHSSPILGWLLQLVGLLAWHVSLSHFFCVTLACVGLPAASIILSLPNSHHLLLNGHLCTFLNPYVEVITPIFIIIAGRTFGRWLCCEGRVFMSWISALKETPGRPLTPSVTWGHSEKMVLDEPGRVSSPHIEFTGTLISDFPVSINVRNKHLLFRLSSHQYFVMVPWTD